MSTTERAAALRAAYKARGWTSRDISVRSDNYSMGSAIRVTIKNPAVPFATAKSMAEGHESIRRCEYSGEILSGGNRYVTVSYSAGASDAIRARYADALNAAASAREAGDDNSLHPIGDTGYLLGLDHNGAFSLWKDHYLANGYRVLDLAIPLHTHRSRA